MVEAAEGELMALDVVEMGGEEYRELLREHDHELRRLRRIAEFGGVKAADRMADALGGAYDVRGRHSYSLEERPEDFSVSLTPLGCEVRLNVDPDFLNEQGVAGRAARQLADQLARKIIHDMMRDASSQK